MTTTAPTGARPRRGRPRHHESPRARVRARHEPVGSATAPVHVTGSATQLTSVVEVDLTGVAAGSVLATIATAAVRAVATHPTVIGRVDAAGTVVRAPGVHLGVLTDDGTTSVVVEAADDLTAAALESRISGAGRTDVRHTLGVVDTGSRGVLLDTPALGPDRSAVLAIGAVVRRPVVRPTGGGEAIVVRAMAHVSLSYDPRLTSGADAARFLHDLQLGVEEGSS